MLNNVKLEMTLERRVQWHAQRRDSINAAMCECVVDDLWWMTYCEALGTLETYPMKLQIVMWGERKKLY